MGSDARVDGMLCCMALVSLLVPVDQHPYSPYPGAGGETVGAASKRQQEREVAEKVLLAVEHCFRRLKAGLKVRAASVHSMHSTIATLLSRV